MAWFGPTGLNAMLRSLDRLGGLPNVSRLTIERPQLYGIRDRADPNKIGQLLTVAGRMTALYPNADLLLPFPAVWKRQVPKEIYHKRMVKGMDRLSLERMATCCVDMSKDLVHNVLDAVGLLRWTAKQRQA